MNQQPERTLSTMSDGEASKTRAIQEILTEVDSLLRERLLAAGIAVSHVLMAIAPDGTGVVRSNIGPADLGDMANLLADIVDGVALERTDGEPLH